MYIAQNSLSRGFFGAIILIMAFLASNALSQEPYPNRPVTVVVPWGPGQTDAIARIICKAAEKELGQPILVENRAGAAGALGANYVFKSKPDGYTLGIIVSSTYLVIPHLRKVPYNPLTDSIEITTIMESNLGLAVKTDAPWKTFKDIIAFARNNPGKFSYACAGIGVSQHICMERVAMQEGIKWTVVPFKAGGEAVVACLGGHTHAVTQGGSDIFPHIKAGKMKVLLTLGNKRWPAFPDVPSILEAGYNFYSMSYTCLSAPKGVPEPIIRKLEDAFNKAKRQPASMEALKKFQVEPSHLSGKAYSDLWRSKYEEMGKVIKAMGIKEEE